MPVAPFAEWTARLAATATAPIWQVDTDCLVPVTNVRKAYERAFEFRDAGAIGETLRRPVDRIHIVVAIMEKVPDLLPRAGRQRVVVPPDPVVERRQPFVRLPVRAMKR